MIYVKSVISTDVIERVKARSNEGKFYTCSTPDGYSGIVVAVKLRTGFFIINHYPSTVYLLRRKVLVI